MRTATLFLAAAVLGLVPAFAHAADASAATPASTSPAMSTPETPAASTPTVTPKVYSDTERAGIEAIIQDYLTKEHPETLMEAAQVLEKREQADAQNKSEAAISKSADKIYEDPTTPIVGDTGGDVTVVEFYDYQCGYCKMSEASVEKLLKEDKKVKFLYKDFPILGPGSDEAAKASVASVKQGKFQKFHDALMNKKDHMNDAVIMQAAKDAGLDIDKLKKDMEDPSVAKVISGNLDLGREIGVRGTPMFIINGQPQPGAMDYDQLKKAVDDARAKKS